MPNPSLNAPQARFLALETKFRAFVAGYGTGKTWVGCASAMKHFWEFPKVNSGYFAPTYPQIRDIFFPTVEEVAFDWGFKVKINASNKEVHVSEGRRYRGTIICRSMEKPGSIIGFKIGRALVDELDTLPTEKAATVWRKIIARLRAKVDGLVNGVDVTTTPEGFRFIYQQFVKALSDKPSLRSLYGLVHASTYENAANLPDDYIESLLASYPPQLIEAYLLGLFVNLMSGNVYPNFSRAENHTDATMEAYEPLHVGMDFNVLNMAAVIYVIRNGLPMAVGELVGVRDTPDMARILKERYRDNGHLITIYPDASGQNRSSKNASESDFSILKQHGFTIKVNPSNPAVKDRVLSVNAMLLNAQGVRRMKVNTHLCPNFTESLEQQPYDGNGEPDKKTGHDHINDAGGYPIVRLFPIVKRSVRQESLRM